MKFNLILSDKKQEIDVMATIIRIKKPEGKISNEVQIGVKFKSFSGSSKKSLKDFLKNNVKSLEVLKYYT